jgi:hypothetical protein
MLTRRQIQKLLDELRSSKLIDKEGTTRSALMAPLFNCTSIAIVVKEGNVDVFVSDEETVIGS